MKKRLQIIVVLLLILSACQSAAETPESDDQALASGQAAGRPNQTPQAWSEVEPLPGGERNELTRADLMAAKYAGDGPVDNRYLAPPAGALPAEHTFEGALTIPEFEMAYHRPSGPLSTSSQTIFPEVSVDFFSYDDHLAPAMRDIVTGDGDASYWSVIFSPGRIWSEPDDSGMSRASFPFLLVGDDYNQAHNGLATFLFDEQQVSSLYLQVTQETAAWHQTDFWGQSPIKYEPRPLKAREALAAALAEELAQQYPLRPWSELANGLDPGLLASFGGGNDVTNISASGIVKDGAIYLRDCNTRYGPYPYCQVMRHGVFSVTKSMGAGVAMLRLAQKYGQQVYDLKLADYVAIEADHDGWDEVTFGDALNMATGVGDFQPQPVEPNIMHGDEDRPKFDNFLVADSAESKLAIVFDYNNYPWGPDEIARYNSINTFLLSAAMDAFLKSQEGPEADIWDMVVEEVYKPIGIQHAPIMRTIEPDGSKGLPIFGYGLYPTVDDVAKVADLLQSGGQHAGQQLLHPGKLAEALYRTEAIGFPAGQRGEAGEYRYQATFWGAPYNDQRGELHIAPYMMGFGGNLVTLLPNGLTAFRFSDAHNYNVESLILAADALAPSPDPTE